MCLTCIITYLLVSHSLLWEYSDNGCLSICAYFMCMTYLSMQYGTFWTNADLDKQYEIGTLPKKSKVTGQESGFLWTVLG